MDAAVTEEGFLAGLRGAADAALAMGWLPASNSCVLTLCVSSSYEQMTDRLIWNRYVWDTQSDFYRSLPRFAGLWPIAPYSEDIDDDTVVVNVHDNMRDGTDVLLWRWHPWLTDAESNVRYRKLRDDGYDAKTAAMVVDLIADSSAAAPT